MRKIQQAIANFEDEREPHVKESECLLEAGKENRLPLGLPERRTILSTPEF